MKAFRAFIKPFEAPQRSMKIKICINSLSLSSIEMGRVKIVNLYTYGDYELSAHQHVPLFTALNENHFSIQNFHS